MFVIGDLNDHHKYWLTYSGRADRPGELSQISLLRCLTFLFQSLTVILTALLFSFNSFLSCNATIFSAMAFPPLGNFDHVVVSVSIGFPSNSKQDAPFTA